MTKILAIAAIVVASLASVAPASAEWGQRSTVVNSDRGVTGAARSDENNFGRQLNDIGGARRG